MNRGAPYPAAPGSSPKNIIYTFINYCQICICIEKRTKINKRGRVWPIFIKKIEMKCCGCGEVVTVLSFYFDDPNLNPIEAISFESVKLCEKNKINKKRKGLDHFYNFKITFSM